MDERPSLVVTPLEGEPITMRGYVSEGIEYVDPRPKRVRRTRYAPMPEGSLYVGRPTIWGNPVTVKRRAPTPRRWSGTASGSRKRALLAASLVGWLSFFLGDLPGRQLQNELGAL